MESHARLRAWLTERDGCARLRDALDAGFAAATLHKATRLGLLVRPWRGVIALPGMHDPHRAALHGAGTRAFLWRDSVVVRAGLLLRGARLDLAVPAGCTYRRSRSSPKLARLKVSEIDLVEGGKSTSLARALLDVAAVRHPEISLRVASEAIRRRLTTPDAILDAYTRFAPRRGRPRVLELVRAVTAERVTRSELEAVAVARLERLGVRFDTNVLVRAGEEVYELDIVLRDADVAIEVDGDVFHRTASDRAADREKDRALRAIGRRVIRVGYRELRLTPRVFDDEVLGALREVSARERSRL